MIELTGGERAVLLTLMTTGGQADANDLAAVLGGPVPDELAERLEGAGLVDTVRLSARRFGPALTEEGWHWCGQELAAGAHGGSDGEPMEGALYGVLAMIGRYLDASGLSLAEFVTLSRARAAR